jgi:hypothetical protein
VGVAAGVSVNVATIHNTAHIGDADVKGAGIKVQAVLPTDHTN